VLTNSPLIAIYAMSQEQLDGDANFTADGKVITSNSRSRSQLHDDAALGVDLIVDASYRATTVRTSGFS